MSTIKTNTLTGTTSAGSIVVTGEGGSTTTNLQQGLIKMWVHAHQHERQDSFNITSQTDNGTGDFTFTATNLLVDRNACAFGSNQSSRNRRGHYVNPLTNGFNVQPTNSSSSYVDDDTSTALIGDLA